MVTGIQRGSSAGLLADSTSISTSRYNSHSFESQAPPAQGAAPRGQVSQPGLQADRHPRLDLSGGDPPGPGRGECWRRRSRGVGGAWCLVFWSGFAFPARRGLQCDKDSALPMRRRRLLALPEQDEGVYHVISRVVDGQHALGSAVMKEQFHGLLRELCCFGEIRLYTYCLMDNHFHLLVGVPSREGFDPGPQETLDVLRGLSSESAAHERQEGERLLREGDHERAQAWARRVNARRRCLASFVQELKQRFSKCYNRLQSRRGTLWEERYKSLLVEGAGRALVTIAAYIDLNPVRAGLVKDPKDYRWSGYGAAFAGDGLAREGIRRIVMALNGGQVLGEKREVLAEYRQQVYREGDERRAGVGEDGRPLRGSLSREEVVKVMQERGRVPLWECVKARVRYLSDGAVLGGRGYVNQVFERYREQFGPARKTGARPMRGLDGEQLYVLRALRVRLFG